MESELMRLERILQNKIKRLFCKDCEESYRENGSSRCKQCSDDYKSKLISSKQKVTRKEAQEMLNGAIEAGWLPSYLREMSCSCFMSAPCSKCCLDGDYLDEYITEFKLEITDEIYV